MDSVTVTFEDGTQATGNLLIGAEGAHSPTREYLVGVQAAALIPSPVVANVSICKISREAAKTLRELHSRYVITFHPKGIFTFMSSKSSRLTKSAAYSQANYPQFMTARQKTPEIGFG